MTVKYANCSKCPLNGNRKVEAVFPDINNKIMIVGEAPGREEEAEGKPFEGASGRLLNWALHEANIHRHQCFITNAIKCRPPNNAITSHEAKEALICCRPQLDAEIRYAKEQGIKTIAALGTTAKNSFFLTESITNIRGSIYEKYNMKVIPTFHPAYLFRQQVKKKKSGEIEETMNYIPIFLQDLKKVKALTEGKIKKPRLRFKYSPTLEDLENFYQKLISQSDPLLGFDIETTGLSPTLSKIVCISLGYDAENVMVVPLIVKGGLEYWNSYDEKIKAYEILNKIFRCSSYLVQNGLFDIPFLKAKGFDVSLDKIKYDLMDLHHTVNAELPHNLGFITSIYGYTPYWKSPFKDRDGGILQMDNFTLWKYNGLDTSVMFQCLPNLLEDAKESDVAEIYEKEVNPLIPVVGEMIQTGMKFNRNAIRKVTDDLNIEIKQLESEMISLGNLPDCFNISSNDDIRYFLYSEEPSKFKDLDHYFQTIENIQNEKVKTNRKNTKIYAENSALKQLKNEVKPIHDTTKYKINKSNNGDKTAINKQALLGLQIKLQNRLEDIKEAKKHPEKFEDERNEIETLLKWISLYNKWSKANKMLTTYSIKKYTPDAEGRIHTQFLIHGTNTGRLSSKHPNLQNIPKKDLRIRRAFEATPGNILISADYSNLEVRILAYAADEPVLMNAFESGKNVHDINTEILFNIQPDHPLWESARAAAKTFFFGNIAYGGGDRTIYEKVILGCPDLNLTFKQFQEAHQRYIDTCQGYAKWRVETIQFARENRFILTPLGRRRDLFGLNHQIEKQALNTPIQGAAAQIINKAMIDIYKARNQQNLKTKIVLQVHDQIVFDAPIDEKEKIISITKSIMQTPYKINDYVVSFPVDISTGPNFGDLTEEE